MTPKQPFLISKAQKRTRDMATLNAVSRKETKTSIAGAFHVFQRMHLESGGRDVRKITTTGAQTVPILT